MTEDPWLDREIFAKLLDERWGNRLRPCQKEKILHRRFVRKVNSFSARVGVFGGWGAPPFEMRP